MDGIVKNGLLPLNGDRSKSVGEEGKGYNRIYFFTNSRKVNKSDKGKMAVRLGRIRAGKGSNKDKQKRR